MGMTIAWTSQISEELMAGALGFPMTEDQLGWVGSLMPLGAATLSLLTGLICNIFGPKLTMLLMITPATLGWLLIIFAQSVAMLYCGRFITGMVAGAFCILTSLYTSEIAQKEIRGALGSFTQLMISSGILVANVIAKFLDVKIYTIICGLVPVVFGLLFAFMPESPVHLLKKNKVDSARSALIRLRGLDYDINQEMKEIQAHIEENQAYSGTEVVKECLKKRSSRKACVIGVGLMIFKVVNGIDAVTTYTAYIFSSSDMGLNAQTSTIVLNVFQVTAAICQSMVVDKSGRRILLWLSGTIMSICSFVVGIAILLKSRNVVSEENYVYIDYLPLIGLSIFTVSFSLGLGPIPWLMMGEIFPQEIKSLAASAAAFISWISAFVIIKLFLLINSSWGTDISFFIFSGCSFAAVVFTLVLVPETKNKTFDEIQKLL